MPRCVRSGLWFLACLAAAPGRSAEPLTVLGQPGLPGRCYLLADGAARVGPDGPVLSEWLAPGPDLTGPSSPAPPHFSWLAPGARVVQCVRAEGDVELTTLTGAGGHGPTGRQALWLFRSMRVTMGDPPQPPPRLCVAISGVGLSLRDDLALLDGENLRLLVSRKPAEVREVDRETVLAFDLTPPAQSDLLVAMPVAPTAYRLRDVPDVRNLKPDFLFGDLVADWQQRVLPDRFSVGAPRVTEAFHAAVGSLLLAPPGEDPPALALSLSALARAGLAPQMHHAFEALIAGQGDDGRFAGVTDPGLHADLTTALADCALYSDAPARWARVLWRPISRAAVWLEQADVPEGAAPRAALALDRAADVAGVVGEAERADALRTRARALPMPDVEVPAASGFEVRGRALQLLAGDKQPAPLPGNADLGSLLPEAYLAMLAGDEKSRERAWDALQAALDAQPLPGVCLSGDTEDSRLAALLVHLIADAVVRTEAGAVHVLPALPAAWGDGGPLVRLADFPCGLGPLRLEATRTAGGGVTLSLPNVPKLAQRLLVSPPLGAEVSGLRANGKPLPAEPFAAGPPWSLDPSIWSVALLPPG
jgi:hypothetical protein